MPKQVLISDNSIEFDSKKYFYDEIYQIRATPENCTSSKSFSFLRKLTLTKNDGSIDEYIFGSIYTRPNHPAYYVEYASLLILLEAELVSRGLRFILDL